MDEKFLMTNEATGEWFEFRNEQHRRDWEAEQREIHGRVPELRHAEDGQ